MSGIDLETLDLARRAIEATTTVGSTAAMVTTGLRSGRGMVAIQLIWRVKVPPVAQGKGPLMSDGLIRAATFRRRRRYKVDLLKK